LRRSSAAPGICSSRSAKSSRRSRKASMTCSRGSEAAERRRARRSTTCTAARRTRTERAARFGLDRQPAGLAGRAGQPAPPGSSKCARAGRQPREVTMRSLRPSPALVIASLALLLAVGGVSYATVKATGNAVNIVDPITATNIAKVDNNGALKTNANITGGNVAPTAPAQPWAASEDLTIGGAPPEAFIAGPTTAAIDITSISLSMSGAAAADGTENVRLIVYVFPGSASACAGSPTFVTTLWHLPRITASAPVTVAFPTPLQYRPQSGMKACLLADDIGAGGGVTLNVSGFYG